VPPELQLLVIVIALLGFWAIVMRPTRVQQRRVAELQSALEVGDEVIISAGIFGTVVAIDDDQVRLEIAQGTVITVARQVVVRRAPDAEQGPARAGDADAESSTDITPDVDVEEKHDRG
jgi:preprotein translocase subunit YajC